MKAVGFVFPSCLTRVFVLGACVMWCGNDAAAQISAVWANDGGDKVLRHELRASTGNMANSVWDGNTIRLFAARNEVERSPASTWARPEADIRWLTPGLSCCWKRERGTSER